MVSARFHPNVLDWMMLGSSCDFSGHAVVSCIIEIIWACWRTQCTELGWIWNWIWVKSKPSVLPEPGCSYITVNLQTNQQNLKNQVCSCLPSLIKFIYSHKKNLVILKLFVKIWLQVKRIPAQSFLLPQATEIKIKCRQQNPQVSPPAAPLPVHRVYRTMELRQRKDMNIASYPDISLLCNVLRSWD